MGGETDGEMEEEEKKTAGYDKGKRSSRRLEQLSVRLGWEREQRMIKSEDGEVETREEANDLWGRKGDKWGREGLLRDRAGGWGGVIGRR